MTKKESRLAKCYCHKCYTSRNLIDPTFWYCRLSTESYIYDIEKALKGELK